MVLRWSRPHLKSFRTLVLVTVSKPSLSKLLRCATSTTSQPTSEQVMHSSKVLVFMLKQHCKHPPPARFLFWTVTGRQQTVTFNQETSDVAKFCCFLLQLLFRRIQTHTCTHSLRPLRQPMCTHKYQGPDSAGRHNQQAVVLKGWGFSGGHAFMRHPKSTEWLQQGRSLLTGSCPVWTWPCMTIKTNNGTAAEFPVLRGGCSRVKRPTAEACWQQQM